MDPLSVIASSIAVFQASVAAVRCVQALVSLRQVPSEFCVLVNELTTLQAVTEQVRTSLEELNKAPLVNVACPSLDVSAALALKSELELIAEQWQALCHRFTKTKENGELRVSKRAWLRQKDSVARLRARASSTRNDLTLCFGALISAHRSDFSHSRDRSRSVVADTCVV